MKIGENINSLLNAYAQRAEEKSGSKTEMTAKAAEAERAGEVPEASEALNSQTEENRDRYVPTAEDAPIGLYELYSDEDGVTAIKFDDPEANDDKNADGKKSADESSDGKAAEDGKKAADGEDKKVKSEKCTGNTDKVDREIERLKKKAEQLEMQLRSAEGDKSEEISRKLAQVQSELARKDNDTYRRAHTVFS